MAVGEFSNNGLTQYLDSQTEKDLKNRIKKEAEYEKEIRKKVNKEIRDDKVKAEKKAIDLIALYENEVEKKASAKSFKEKVKQAKELNEIFAKGADTFGEKLKYNAKAVGAELLSAALSFSSAATSGIDKYMDTYQDYMSMVTTRLQGTENNYSKMMTTISTAIGSSPYASQTKVMQNLSELVKAGISSNVEQRAFLASVSDRIATTFNVFDSNLLRLVRLQQADTTAARLGVESALNKFLNTNFADTSYLSDVSDSITSILLGVESQLGYKGGVQFDYAVQKWLGSLYSVGVSQNTIQSLAQGIGYLGTGNISALSSNTALQNLLLLASQRGGADYSSILSTGFTNTAQVDQIMTGLISLMQNISGNNPIVRSKYAEILGLTIEDITALTNINASDLKAISSSILDFSGAIKETNDQLSSIGERTSLKDKITNVIQNTFASMGSQIASNAVTYGTWIATGMLQQSGIADSLKQTVLGTTVDPVGLVRTGIVGLSALTQLSNIFAGIFGKNLLDINAFGGQTVLERGGASSSKIITTGVKSETSLESYYGSLDDNVIRSRFQEQTGEYNTLTGAKPTDAEEEAQLLQTHVSTYLQQIYDLLSTWDNSIRLFRV